MTLTSAPVSKRKRKRLALSVIKNRRLGGRPEVLVTNSTRPGRFPTKNSRMCTFGPCPQSGDGTSKVPGVGQERRLGRHYGTGGESWSS